MKPFFSIIIPLYNKEKHIKNTLQSVLDQSFSNFEVIIVNDGSTDNSLNQVNAVIDERIKVYSIENSGVSAARNYGIKKAQAEYITFLDADDLWESHHLKNLDELLKTFPDCGLYATAYNRKLQDKILKVKYHLIPHDTTWMGIVSDYFKSSIYNPIAWTSAVMVPKKILETLNGFDENITLGAGEDTDLWIRIALKYRIAFHSKVTAIHNLHADNRLSNTNTNKRAFIDLNKYETFASSNSSLKKYLDINKFSIGLQYKLSGNKERAQTMFESLDTRSLNKKQLFLMRLNKPLLHLFVKIQNGLRTININLTPFH
ncbi:MAG TPA: glycosyltransferase family A protein [Xanthomarina sp.]|nr:glycosyltransferase family A protein [Xanthomarina sp.]